MSHAVSRPDAGLLSNIERLLPRAIEWAESLETRLREAGSPLNPCQEAIASKAGIIRTDLVRVIEVERFPAPTDPELAKTAYVLGILSENAAGMAVGYAVVARKGYLNQRVLAHELRHVAQYERAGSVAAFLKVYLVELATYGYDRAPLELDALAFEASAFHVLVASFRSPDPLR